MEFTFDSLSQTIADFVENDNPQFIASIPTIIGLGEQRLLRDLNLSIFDEDRADTFTAEIERQTKPVPTSGKYRATISLAVEQYSGEKAPVLRRSHDFVKQYNSGVYALGIPKYFCDISANEWLVAPKPQDDFGFIAYMERIPEGLSNTNQSTWLAEHAADALFYSCLMNSEGYLKADNRMAMWDGHYNNELVPALRLRLADYIRDDDMAVAGQQ